MDVRNSLWFRGVAFVVLLSTAFTFTISDLVWAEQLVVVVPAGTPVAITFDKSVSSGTSSTGSYVSAVVSRDVVIDGKVVIRAGAPCHAVVEDVTSAGIVGTPGEITVVVNSVTAVDGSTIPISGAIKGAKGESQLVTALVITIFCILGLLVKGKQASIPSGTQVTGFTIGQATISL